MAALTVNKISPLGWVQALVAASAGGDTFANDERTFLIVANGHVSPQRVVVDDVGTPAPVGAQAFDPDLEVSVTNGTTRLIGPFSKARFGGTPSVSYPDGVTALTVAAVSLPPS